MVELTSDLVGTAGRLSGLSSDLAEVAERPAGSVEGRDLATITDTAAQLSRELERLASQLANSAVALTFQAFSEAVHGLDRAAHDLATSGGKQVRVRVSGGDVEVDRAVISGLREPLLHVVRNAVDHGIEPPDERRAAAKGPVGTVDIAARLDGDALVVEIRDDGRGIDHDAVRAAAARAGVSGAPGAGVDDATGAAAPLDTSELLFLPGLTTARQVTDASGRGVGLDAVRDRVEGLGGTVRLHSSSPRGTTVSISVPANTALVKVLVVRSGGELLSLPLAKVARVLAVDPSAVHEAEGRTRVAVDGTTVPMAALHATAGISADRGLAAGPLKVAMVEVAGRPFAFAVDELVGESEAIVKPPPRRLADVRAVRGRAILADGNIALLLNIAVCVEGALSRPEQLVVDDATGTPAPTRVLLVEDSRTTRVLEAGILRAAGYAVVEAEDGAAAWELLQEHEVDLVLSDVDMPRLDGVELCRLVRRSPELADLPVVLVTSLGDEADRRRGVDAGASAYIVKAEFDQDSLLDVLERVR
jgi:two-component system chemotaxis sensor kinase CheA